MAEQKWSAAEHELRRLLDTMATLRGEDGCPWDREQTLESLKPFLVEECYEVLDAIDRGDVDEHCEELGDLLLQVVFQAQIRSEAGDFSFAEVARAIADKLVRRHPHVFGDAADTADWEAIKAHERAAAGKSGGRLSGLPATLPALLLAFRMGQKAAAVGFDWPSIHGALAKLREEVGELEEAIGEPEPSRTHLADELGDVLFAACNVARHLKMDPEDALRATTRKFRRRFAVIEEELDRAGESFDNTSLDRLEGLWKIAKSRE